MGIDPLIFACVSLSILVGSFVQATAGLGIGLIAAFRLLRIVTGRVTEAEIAHFAGEFRADPADERERPR